MGLKKVITTIVVSICILLMSYWEALAAQSYFFKLQIYDHNQYRVFLTVQSSPWEIIIKDGDKECRVYIENYTEFINLMEKGKEWAKVALDNNVESIHKEIGRVGDVPVYFTVFKRIPTVSPGGILEFVVYPRHKNKLSNLSRRAKRLIAIQNEITINTFIKHLDVLYDWYEKNKHKEEMFK